MTFDYRKRFQTSLLYLFIVVLYSTAIPTLAQESERFVLNEVKLVSDPTVGTTYTGDREIDPSTKLIQAEDWDPEKVPPLKKHTIDFSKQPYIMPLVIRDTVLGAKGCIK